jgi:hypothetical protein
MAYRAICGVLLTEGELVCQRHPEPVFDPEPVPKLELASLEV